MNPIVLLALPFGILLLLVLTAIIRSIRIVPAQTALVVERLGKYARTLEAGFHVLIPFIEKVRYKHNLKEQAVDVPAQDCFTCDNVKVKVDGVLYMKVVESRKASYGIKDYRYGTIQLAQTTMRSVIGKMELDKSFEEREQINREVVKSVDEASDPWGVKITRYEIQNIQVPPGILDAMEVQMKSEREKRAAIARSQGEMESLINISQAVMEEAINKSEGEKERMINEAQGKAQEILTVAKASAESIKLMAQAIAAPGGDDAAGVQLSEKYIDELGKLAKAENRIILPLNLNDMDEGIQKIRGMVKK